MPDLQPCGTMAAAKRHYKRGEALCEPCRKAVREDSRRRYYAATPAPCVECGLPILNGGRLRRYCSSECRSAARRRPCSDASPRECQTCGQPFMPITANQVQCSPTCRKAAKKARRRAAYGGERTVIAGATSTLSGVTCNVRVEESRHGGVLVWCPTCGDCAGIHTEGRIWDRWCAMCDHYFTVDFP